MGWAAKANGGWRQRRPWQGVEHPHQGAYGLAGVLVSGLEPGQRAEIDLAVGPAGKQQECARLVVRGSGEAVLPEPLNFRGGAPLWFRADADCQVATRTADIVPRELTAAEAAQEALRQLRTRLGMER